MLRARHRKCIHAYAVCVAYMFVSFVVLESILRGATCSYARTFSI